MTTRRSVETLFYTASDSMVNSDLMVKRHDELELTVTDVMFANLTLSPPQTLTQLSVVADPPKHVTKAKERGKQTKAIICIPCKHKENVSGGVFIFDDHIARDIQKRLCLRKRLTKCCPVE